MRGSLLLESMRAAPRRTHWAEKVTWNVFRHGMANRLMPKISFAIAGCNL
jgi:hypothetical protein